MAVQQQQQPIQVNHDSTEYQYQIQNAHMNGGGTHNSSALDMFKSTLEESAK